MDIREETGIGKCFPRRLYESRREDPNRFPSGYEIGEELGLERDDARTLMESLGKAGKIEIMSAGYIVDIKPPGIEEVERDLLESSDTEDKKEAHKNKKTNPKKVFVVSGRNEKARRALFGFLRSIGLDPMEWNQAIESTGKATPFIGETLDRAFEVAQAIIVLITGDDLAKLKDQYIKADDDIYEKEYTPQARPNVIFEAGLAFGRCSDRTVIVVLEKELTRPFSDISGRHLVKLSNKTESRMDIISRLKTAGCETDIEGKKDWMHTGDFEGVIDRNFTIIAKDELPKNREQQSDKIKILIDCIKRGESLLTNFSSEDYKRWEDRVKIALSRNFGKDSEIYEDFQKATGSKPLFVFSGTEGRKEYFYSKTENQIHILETHLEFIK